MNILIIILIIIALFIANHLGYKQGLITPKEYNGWPRWLWCAEYQNRYWYLNWALVSIVGLLLLIYK